MSGSLLIIDEDENRRTGLAALLSRRYLNAVATGDADRALAAVDRLRPALALLAATGDEEAVLGFCRDLKQAGGGRLPILIYASDETAVARRAALRAGADDALVLPRDEVLLLARARSLLRLRAMAEELDLREETARELGLEPQEAARDAGGEPARVLLVAPRNTRTTRIAEILEKRCDLICRVVETGFDALRRVEREAPDAVVVSGAAALNEGGCGFAERENPFELIQSLAATEAGRCAAILYLTVGDGGRAGRIAAALDAGAADCAFLDSEAEELSIRLRNHLSRKRYGDRLRSVLAQGLRQSVRDPLTGLHNRRYLDAHFERRFSAAKRSGAPLSVLMFDLDRFKAINDRHGHIVGDAALAAFAATLSDEVRVADLVCRYGGEEFVVIMPGATIDQAASAGERVRARARESRIPELRCGAFTVSAGAAELNGDDRSAADLLARADAALRRSKDAGRDRLSVA